MHREVGLLVLNLCNNLTETLTLSTMTQQKMTTNSLRYKWTQQNKRRKSKRPFHTLWCPLIKTLVFCACRSDKMIFNTVILLGFISVWIRLVSVSLRKAHFGWNHSFCVKSVFFVTIHARQNKKSKSNVFLGRKRNVLMRRKNQSPCQKCPKRDFLR